MWRNGERGKKKFSHTTRDVHYKSPGLVTCGPPFLPGGPGAISRVCPSFAPLFVGVSCRGWLIYVAANLRRPLIIARASLLLLSLSSLSLFFPSFSCLCRRVPRSLSLFPSISHSLGSFAIAVWNTHSLTVKTKYARLSLHHRWLCARAPWRLHMPHATELSPLPREIAAQTTELGAARDCWIRDGCSKLEFERFLDV